MTPATNGGATWRCSDPFHFVVPWLLLCRVTPIAIVPPGHLYLAADRHYDFYMMVRRFDAGSHCLGEAGRVSHLFFHWVDPFAVLAVGGLWVWMFMGELKKRPLLAIGDPYLRQALESGGGGH